MREDKIMRAQKVTMNMTVPQSYSWCCSVHWTVTAKLFLSDQTILLAIVGAFECNQNRWSNLRLRSIIKYFSIYFFFQAEDGIRDWSVTGVQTCALPIYDRVGELRVRAGRRIEPAQKIFDEIRVPHPSLGIRAHVVRSDRLARQVVLGDEDAGRTTRRSRQRPELIRPSPALAQIDGRKIGGQLAQRLFVVFALDRPLLHALHRAVVRVARHALEYDQHSIGVVSGSRDALERVTTHAFDERAFLLDAARHAHQPFSVGKLGGEIPCLAQLDFELRLGLRGDIHRRRAVQFVSDGPYPERVSSWHEASGKFEEPAPPADDGEGDRRSVLASADQYALHRPFVDGTDPACKRRRSARPGSLRAGKLKSGLKD